jgi:hypothetical protein
MAKLAAVVPVYNERNALEPSSARRSIQRITLREDHLGFEAEIAKVVRRRPAHLRSAHLELRAHVRRGQEDRLARRGSRPALRALVQPVRGLTQH